MNRHWCAAVGTVLLLGVVVAAAAATADRGRPAPAAKPRLRPAPAAKPRLLPAPYIVQSPIPFPQARKNQMRQYALANYGIDTWRMPHPHLIIWHYTDSATYSSVWNTFAQDVPDVEYHLLPQVCAHFVITTHGTIHQLVPLDIMCRQVVGLDYTSIGIENVGFSDQQVMGDARQYHAALTLTRWLRCRFDIPVKNVIGHNESLQSPYYRERIASLRGQTHSDFDHHDMDIVRTAVRRLPCRASR
jgi:beta-N-acetylhexosaminidase